MSFGCGIGDLIQVSKLISRAIKSVQNAPSNFSEAEQTVSNLDVLFNALKSEIQKPESVFTRDPAQGERLALLTQSCETTLKKLCDILDKYPSLGGGSAKVIDRLRFSRKEIQDVQRELQLRYSNLSAFLETIGIGGVGRIEYKVDSLAMQQERLLQAMDRFANLRVETNSILSNYSNDDKTVWKQLRRDLNSAGFKSSDLEKHKHLIYQKLVELQSSGMLEWHGGNGIEDDLQSVRSMRSVGSVKFIGYTKQNYRAPYAETAAGSDDEDDHYTIRPAMGGALFEDSDEDLFDRTGVQEEKTFTKPEKLPAYQDAVSSPRLKIPVPTQPRGSQSAGNSPRTSTHAFPPQMPSQYLGTSPRLAPGFVPRSPIQYASSPRHSSEAIPQIRRQPSDYDARKVSFQDEEIRTGKRSTPNIVWRYRRPADVQRPPMQSADLDDGTLPKAAAEGRTADVQRLLMTGYNIESTGARSMPEVESFQGTTALYRAARNLQFETAHLLLRYGANPNCTRSDGKALLRLLATDGATELVRLLLEYGATHIKTGALPQAALFGHLPIVQLLLNYGADINEVEKQTPLYRAASKNYSDIVDLLLREGADTTWVAPSGPSALYKAVSKGNFKCTRSLLLYGANPAIGVGIDGETALYTACKDGHEPTVRLLLNRGARPDDSFYVPYAVPLQRRDGGIDEFFPDGPLFAAVRRGRLNITRLLLDYGADITLRTHGGQTAIDIAFERGFMAIVDLLYNHGARLSPAAIEAAEKREAWERKLLDSQQAQRRPGSSGSFGPGGGLAPDYAKMRSKSSSYAPSSVRTSGGTKKSTKSNLGAAAVGAVLFDSLVLLGGG